MAISTSLEKFSLKGRLLNCSNLRAVIRAFSVLVTVINQRTDSGINLRTSLQLVFVVLSIQQINIDGFHKWRFKRRLLQLLLMMQHTTNKER